MKYHILAFGAGFLMDQIFGDPYFLPHPIRGIGWLIAKTEKALRSGNPQEDSPEREYPSSPVYRPDPLAGTYGRSLPIPIGTKRGTGY